MPLVRDQKQMLDRFDSNIERSRNNLVLTEVTLQDSVNILKRAYELTIQADNDVLTPTDRQAIGLEITQLKEALWGLLTHVITMAIICSVVIV